MLKYTVNEYFPNTGKNEKEKKKLLWRIPSVRIPKCFALIFKGRDTSGDLRL